MNIDRAIRKFAKATGLWARCFLNGVPADPATAFKAKQQGGNVTMWEPCAKSDPEAVLDRHRAIFEMLGQGLLAEYPKHRIKTDLKFACRELLPDYPPAVAYLLSQMQA